MTHLGFSGSREGMSIVQHALVFRWVQAAYRLLGALHVHHGLCDGADAQFHAIARAMQAVVHGHPGVTKTGEAKHRATLTCDVLYPELEFLERNCVIVLAADVMIAAPQHKEEALRGSGTWATIRYTRKTQTPLLVAFPDGMWETERLPAPWVGLTQGVSHAQGILARGGGSQ